MMRSSHSVSSFQSKMADSGDPGLPFQFAVPTPLFVRITCLQPAMLPW